MSSTLLRRLRPSYLTGEVRRIIRKHWRRLRRDDLRVVSLPPTAETTSGQGGERGAVLLSYILDPFLLPPGCPIPHSHTHFWESRTIAETWRQLGYRVDVISWTNHRFVPERDYDVVIDVRLNLERLAPLLPETTVKVLHTDTSHWRFNNAAQEERLDALVARRGTPVRPVKMLPENRAPEVADVITYLGNTFTASTYRFAGKPMFRVPVSVPSAYPWPEGKDWEAARRHFLWFGSGGLVHKGLDVVLEAFTGLPDLHLTVCGPVHAERDFERAYARELYHTPNITTHGWIDVAGPEFLELARRVGALVYPSCAEGGGSSALTCMHAGIVPVLTREASVDLEPSWAVELAGWSVEEVRAAAREVALRPAVELEGMARAGWEFVRGQHSKEHFRAAYRGFAERVIGGTWREGGR